ncbi:hypothetical protein O4J56_05065 [Nocardiopsis sp. RSe5-2]|uniref:Integral membrane protein n=1 Tax=Nocardiopsis endophytica TaxID=3018445 RepID=A0ABT4TZ80_9ACTN|nr:hypothetical protein [Nocardiopsis endophytica]MDA2810000.1 hypothetical protein [Nocardiopsis endophytica]
MPDSASAGRSGPFASAVDFVVLPALFCAAVVVGIVGGVLFAWVAWLWLSGPVGQVLAGAALLVWLCLMYAAVRTAGWATGSRAGAGVCAVGWALAQVALLLAGESGDVFFLLSSAGISNAYLYGGVAVVTFAVVFTPPAGARAD